MSFSSLLVIPAQAGIQVSFALLSVAEAHCASRILDSCLRRNDIGSACA